MGVAYVPQKEKQTAGTVAVGRTLHNLGFGEVGFEMAGNAVGNDPYDNHDESSCVAAAPGPWPWPGCYVPLPG